MAKLKSQWQELKAESNFSLILFYKLFPWNMTYALFRTLQQNFFRMFDFRLVSFVETFKSSFFILFK